MENRKACLVNARDQDSWHHHCPTAFTSLPKYLANDVWLHKKTKSSMSKVLLPQMQDAEKITI